MAHGVDNGTAPQPNQPAPPVVVCEGVTRLFGQVRAVEDLSLTARRGEILALLGPSGCGKTTALRLIAGMEKPDQGSVTVGGQTVAHSGIFVPPERRSVGMVFQDYALFPHLTVAQNVAFGLHRRTPKNEVTAHVDRMLGLVGLRGLGGRMPHALSGGQQQRVALARALAPGPTVLLLDEPFSNLDARLRNSLRREVRAILRQAGTCSIFVTHDQAEAMFMGDRIALLNGGRLEQIGAPEEVFMAPASRFVADFLGRSDFVPGSIEDDGWVATELGRLPTSSHAARGTRVEVLLRPNDTRIELDAIGPASIVDRTFEGLHHVYRLALPSGQVVRCISDVDPPIEIGRSVRLRLREGGRPICFLHGRALPPSSARDPAVEGDATPAEEQTTGER